MSPSSVRGALIRLLVFAVFAASIGALLYNTLTNTLTGKTISYSATFSDASGLHSGDNVRVAGVRVGRVDAVKLRDNVAWVKFTLEAEQPVLRSTGVAIRYLNLIGQRYLALVPGTGATEPLPAGSEIPLTQTQNAFDLTVVTNGFQPLFEVLAPDDINKLSAQLVQVLQGEGGSITELLRTTAQLSGKLADRDEVIGRVITNLAQVATDVGSRDAEVDALVGQLRRLADAAAQDREKIGSSIAALADLTDATTGLLTDIRPLLRTDLDKLNKVVATYAQAKEPFGAAIRGLPLALAAFARQMQYGSWINIYICNLVVNNSKVLNSGANSEVCA
ncbi:MCE family protein [Sporichthya sp.]|uniref:MCE family protein n=1 Tax=Sporichthya sp. TaxID=65475 RepID=UPI0017F49009|nr:MCE family protein [Sporichthya sp.]MBA3744409.1 MCE family protein [Sporichthya sp.]